jgi:hypothetical protein
MNFLEADERTFRIDGLYPDKLPETADLFSQQLTTKKSAGGAENFQPGEEAIKEIIEAAKFDSLFDTTPSDKNKKILIFFLFNNLIPYGDKFLYEIITDTERNIKQDVLKQVIETVYTEDEILKLSCIELHQSMKDLKLRFTYFEPKSYYIKSILGGNRAINDLRSIVGVSKPLFLKIKEFLEKNNVLKQILTYVRPTIDIPNLISQYLAFMEPNSKHILKGIPGTENYFVPWVFYAFHYNSIKEIKTIVSDRLNTYQELLLHLGNLQNAVENQNKNAFLPLKAQMLKLFTTLKSIKNDAEFEQTKEFIEKQKEYLTFLDKLSNTENIEDTHALFLDEIQRRFAAQPKPSAPERRS